VVFHSLAQGGVSLGEHFRHEKEGGPDIETVPVALELTTSPARGSVLLEYSDLEAVARQVRGSGNAPEAGADYQCSWT